MTGGTKVVGCELSPSWYILSTITPTATTAPASTTAAATTAPYADQGGQCHIHVNEYRSCTNDTDNLNVEITMWDVASTQIGYQALTEAGANNPLDMPSKLEAYLEVTPEHTGDYIQFTLGTESWKSTDNDKSAAVYCNTGGWDPKEDPFDDPDYSCALGSLIQQRQMDCYFQCPWHGGKSSDASSIRRILFGL